MARKTDWYQHLVNQSDTDHIYDLIHEYIPGDWHPGHDLDFVVLRKSEWPAHFLHEVPTEHLSTAFAANDYGFPAADYLVLHNDHLTAYLEKATAMRPIVDSANRGFIELFFQKKPAVKRISRATMQPDIPDPYQNKPWELDDLQDGLLIAYDMLQKGEDRELALQYAQAGLGFLESTRVQLSDGGEVMGQISNRMMGYNIIAMVYAWNDRIREAAAIDAHYLRNPLVWHALEAHIKAYLTMLMAKRCDKYLAFLFEDPVFRQQFRAHYEAYRSVLDPHFEWTQSLISEIVPVLNLVKNSCDKYR